MLTLAHGLQGVQVRVWREDLFSLYGKSLLDSFQVSHLRRRLSGLGGIIQCYIPPELLLLSFG